MTTLAFKNVNKVFDKNNHAVKDFNLEVEDGEFIVLVGPSGCGKSTTLRMLAGLDEITGGEILIDEKIVNDVEPKERDIAMVFQNYALYPHMTAYDNMSFSLKMNKKSKDEIEERVHNAAEILGITELLEKKPKTMSGGQRQRVALGRSIVRDPKIFLMDEPLSNLDAKLRVQMRSEITKLQKRLNATVVYVTHDQTEAMTMASRIVVMNKGEIQQIGTPQEIYETPANRFVAEFIGSPPMNIIEAKIDGNRLDVGEASLRMPTEKREILHGYDKEKVLLGVRSEDLYDDTDYHEKTEDNSLTMTIDTIELLGSETILLGKIQGDEVQAKLSSRFDYDIGDEVTLSVDLDKIHFYDVETEKALGR